MMKKDGAKALSFFVFMSRLLDCPYKFHIFLPPQNAATEGSPFGRAPALAGERECDHQ